MGLRRHFRNDGVLASQVPFLYPTLANTQYDWNYTTTAQSGFAGRSIAYPRGKILGGTSSINAMIYTRGTVDDWNRWADVTGDKGWSWPLIYPYFIKVCFV